MTNRMTGTFYGEDHGMVVGTVNTEIVIGTYEAVKDGGHAVGRRTKGQIPSL